MILDHPFGEALGQAVKLNKPACRQRWVSRCRETSKRQARVWTVRWRTALRWKFCLAIPQGCSRLHCSPTRSGTTTMPRGATWCNCHWLEIAGGCGLWRILGSCISIQNLLALLFFAEVRVHRWSLHVTTLFLYRESLQPHEASTR